MQKTAAQMQSIKRAVEETAMFSASIIAKVKSKIKKIESSFNISPSASTCSPNDKYGGTGGSQSIARGADDNKSKMLFQKKHQLFEKTGPKPAYGRQGLDWIVGPGYSFGVFSTYRGI